MARGEFDLIAQHFGGRPLRPGTLIGVGDDAAVLDSGAPLLSCAAGWQRGADGPLPGAAALAAALLAEVDTAMRASGGQPRWLTLALSLESADEAWIGEFSAALHAAAAGIGAELVGGDTTGGCDALALFCLGPADTTPAC